MQKINPSCYLEHLKKLILLLQLASPVYAQNASVLILKIHGSIKYLNEKNVANFNIFYSIYKAPPIKIIHPTATMEKLSQNVLP